MPNALITFQELLLSVNALALNKEQNMQISPDIFSVAARLSTDFVLDEIVRVYPYNQRIVDKARPFLKRKLVTVEDGIATFPDDYRNVLEIRIATNKDATEGCNCDEEDCEKVDDHCTETEKASIRKEKCYFVKVVILDSDQYADATQSDLYPPSLKNPIGTWVNRTQFKICPIEGITYVEVIYLKHPLKYEIGYTVMPDDTWQINPATTIDLEWERTASTEIWKCMTSLLGLHTRDGNFIQWNNELKKIGMF